MREIWYIALAATALLLGEGWGGAYAATVGPNSLVIVACKVTDWTGRRPLPPGVVALPDNKWRDLDLYINPKKQAYECQREVLEDLQDMSQYSSKAGIDFVPMNGNFTKPGPCLRAGVPLAQAWNEKHVGNIEDDRPDNDGWAVVGVGCPSRYWSDNGTPQDKTDDIPLDSYKLPDCPTYLPGTNNRMKCEFDESEI